MNLYFMRMVSTSRNVVGLGNISHTNARFEKKRENSRDRTYGNK